MEYWSDTAKKITYYTTMALTILFPLAIVIFVLVFMIMGLTALNDIATATALSVDPLQLQGNDTLKSIFGEANFNEIMDSAVGAVVNAPNETIDGFTSAFVAPCVVLIVFFLSLVLLPVFRHISENMFFKITPVVIYGLIILFAFNVIIGMSITTLSSTFPMPIIGFVTIPSDVGKFVLIGFLASMIMVVLSLVNVKAKGLLR